MTLAKTWWETREARARARKAEFDLKAAKDGIVLHNIGREDPPVRRLGSEQRTKILKYLHDNLGGRPQERFLTIIPIPVDDCSSYAGELKLTFDEAGFNTLLHFGGIPSQRPITHLFRAGIWLRGTDKSIPPTNILVAEALEKAGIKATLIDEDNLSVELIIGTGERE